MAEKGEVVVYDVPSVAALLGVSRNHAYGMVREGVIPSVRLGRRLLVPRAALDEWLRLAAASTQ